MASLQTLLQTRMIIQSQQRKGIRTIISSTGKDDTVDTLDPFIDTFVMTVSANPEFSIGYPRRDRIFYQRRGSRHDHRHQSSSSSGFEQGFFNCGAVAAGCRTSRCKEPKNR